MKLNKSELKYSILAIVISLAVVPVFAKTTNSADNTPKASPVQNIATQDLTDPKLKPLTQTQKQENRCEAVRQKIQKKVENYQDNREKYIDKYQMILDRLSNLVTKLEADGYDVTKLKADLATAQDKIENLFDLHSNFIAQLETAKSFDCESTDGKYKASIGEAQNHLTGIKDAVADIRLFFNETIKPDVLALKTLIGEKNRELNWGTQQNKEQNANEITEE